MQERARRAEYPIVSPGALKSLADAFHPILWRIKTLGLRSDHGAGRFYGHQKLWGERCCQEREGLIVLDVAAVAGGDKAHLANARNSNLKWRCEQSSLCYLYFFGAHVFIVTGCWGTLQLLTTQQNSCVS